jgi:hypothetical protein
MKLGAEPKKIAIFAGLILMAVVLQFMGSDGPEKSSPRSGPVTPPVPVAAPVRAGAGPRTVAPASTQGARPNSNRRTSQEFKPVLRPRRVEDRIDPTTIDPTLRTDLLERLEEVEIQGGSRPLFEFSAAPPPKAPDPGKIVPAKPVAGAKPPFALPVKPTTLPTKPVDGAKPQAPPIPLKFYGFTAVRAGAKRAFFLENEDVFVANEGEVVKKRYKVVRVNMNSVVMEDLEFKQQQTLPLTEQSQ